MPHNLIDIHTLARKSGIVNFVHKLQKVETGRMGLYS